MFANIQLTVAYLADRGETTRLGSCLQSIDVVRIAIILYVSIVKHDTDKLSNSISRLKILLVCVHHEHDKKCGFSQKVSDLVSVNTTIGAIVMFLIRLSRCFLLPEMPVEERNMPFYLLIIIKRVRDSFMHE